MFAGFLPCLGGIATAVGKKILRSSSSLSQLVPNSSHTAATLLHHLHPEKIKVWKPTTTKSKREMMFLFKSINSWALSIFFRWFSIFTCHINIDVTQETLRQSVLDVSDERQRTVIPTENAMSEFKEERFADEFDVGRPKVIMSQLVFMGDLLCLKKNYSHSVIVTKRKWEPFEAGRCGVS